jgi:uncharacterized membrane protein (UPF0182 family)
MGTLLVIPVEESLLYVTPLYLRSEGGRIPELKRVIVAYENTIVMEPTLDGAMDALFGAAEVAEAPDDTEAATDADTETETATDTEAEPAVTATDAEATAAQPLVRRALSHFERAIEAQRAGDWARYGQEIGRVEQLLRRMAPPPPPQP